MVTPEHTVTTAKGALQVHGHEVSKSAYCELGGFCNRALCQAGRSFPDHLLNKDVKYFQKVGNLLGRLLFLEFSQEMSRA